ncbi:MAG: leucyl aminopeptidase, partial [Mycobacterium sp.]|nr:leucyl aminopeptidase [Mycobacterium sp.]
MSTAPGYQSPTVTVSATLPKRGIGSSVLIVPVVTEDDQARVVANPFLDAEAVGEIEVALKALGAKGGTDSTTRVVVPSLPVASVLAVGLGKARDEWPGDVVRRASGAAARALNGTESVVTALSEIDVEAAIEGLILGSYRFSDFRSAKTAPKEPGLAKITALSTAKSAKADAVRGTNVATAVATARDLVN